MEIASFISDLLFVFEPAMHQDNEQDHSETNEHRNKYNDCLELHAHTQIHTNTRLHGVYH